MRRVNGAGVVGGLLLCWACRVNETAPPTYPPALVDVQSLFVWRDSSITGNVRPAFDASSVFHMSFQHVVSATDKSAGGVRWRTILPVTDPSRNGRGLLLAGGVLVVGDRDLFGLDPATGAILWNYAPSVGNSPGFGRLATDGGTVFCGSTSGHVFAVDGRTGREVWATSIAQSATANVGVYDPVVRDGVVYVGYTTITSIRGTSGVAALDARAGRVFWTTALPDESADNPSGAFTGVAVADRRVIAPSGDGSVYALTRSSGVIEQRLPSSLFDPEPPRPGGTFRALFGVGENVYLTSANGHIAALRASDLVVRWRVRLGIATLIDVVADEEYIFTPQAGGPMFALRARDGTSAWVLRNGDFRRDEREDIIAGPGIDGDRLYFGGDREVYALKRD